MSAFWQIYSLVIIQIALLDHLCISAGIPSGQGQHKSPLYAACKIKPSSGAKIFGMVLFKQESSNGTLSVVLKLRGFDRESAETKAVHIHQFGDLSSGCASTGGHYNPHNVNHPQHPGDFGNFMTKDGHISATLQSEATLFGEHSVIGRAVVIHQHQDDLGQGGNDSSLQNGNAGPRIGCCIIGITSVAPWIKHTTSKTSKRLREN
ncbi:unnamed protein product [Knipowitschia caucasica]|uniref:Superoxide dismutase [Cu-Zn] n=1 Tax=Knipowitschia caucasica TaxID=637954 RepID=A0AAV2LJQ6_KNICA